MIPIELTLIGLASFLLHFLGKWKETTLPFIPWFVNKDSIIYWTSSLALCALSLLMREEVMELAGFTKPMVYVFVACYGGGHLVGRVMGMKAAAAEKKAQAHA